MIVETAVVPLVLFQAGGMSFLQLETGVSVSWGLFYPGTVFVCSATSCRNFLIVQTPSRLEMPQAKDNGEKIEMKRAEPRRQT